MTVKKYMSTKVHTISPEKTLADALKIMVKFKTNSLIVVDDNYIPVGVVSSHLLIQAVVPEHLKNNEIIAQFSKLGTLAKYAKDNANVLISEIMDKDFHVLNEQDAMIEAATYVIKGERRILPVVDSSQNLIGAITRTHIKMFLYNCLFNQEYES